ncbi:MAG TPA: alpha-L-arabinofuranosidase C-terminal domain-containing protein, partial [Chitinophagaceae bacterium]|nr:alpha-L-arabinofuranosidase C-terminal domain-containing protein [Chitinophagaceae bacterium]
VMYRQSSPGISLSVELSDSLGNVIGTVALVPAESGTTWKKQAVSFTATATLPKATMTLWFEGTGTIDLDIISLFPGDTWKNRPGGMRADMIQLLADMKPGFIRFPGGCIVEGYDLASRYQWKKTIGPVEERQLVINRWNNEFAHRPAPDYFQTFGLGFFEYFQLAEDIGAAPLPILNCGMACQFNSGEVVPVDDLDPYVQDALDLIEFANGDTSTKWGKVRAGMGHRAPFNLTMMGVGNENWGPQYLERLQVFTKAIKDKYPAFRIITSSGTDPDGERFNLLNNELRARKADLIDEHYYRRPEWFLQNAGRYDTYDRNGPKIFAGEYAAQSDKTVSVNNRNNWLTALSEAAFMTGLERNAAVVHMASYAPLFAHVDGWQWTPDLIWVDNLRSYGTTDYHVQKLFSLNRGTHEVSIHQENELLNGKNDLFAAAAIDSARRSLIIKLVNASKSEKVSRLQVNGVRKLRGKARLITLQHHDLDAMNTLEHPTAVVPLESDVPLSGKSINLTLKPYSFTVIRLPMF